MHHKEFYNLMYDISPRESMYNNNVHHFLVYTTMLKMLKKAVMT